MELFQQTQVLQDEEGWFDCDRGSVVVVASAVVDTSDLKMEVLTE